MFATLLDHFHMSLDDIRLLTDRQIQELYFHPRGDKGEIEAQKEPPKPGTLDFEIWQSREVAKQLGIDPHALAERIRQQWTTN